MTQLQLRLVCFGGCHNAFVNAHLTKGLSSVLQQQEVKVVFPTASKMLEKLVIPNLAQGCYLLKVQQNKAHA